MTSPHSGAPTIPGTYIGIVLIEGTHIAWIVVMIEQLFGILPFDFSQLLMCGPLHFGKIHASFTIS